MAAAWRRKGSVMAYRNQRKVSQSKAIKIMKTSNEIVWQAAESKRNRRRRRVNTINQSNEHLYRVNIINDYLCNGDAWYRGNRNGIRVSSRIFATRISRLCYASSARHRLRKLGAHLCWHRAAACALIYLALPAAPIARHAAGARARHINATYRGAARIISDATSMMITAVISCGATSRDA